ncbi:hypothetical protein RRG08_046372 [Elysia crispata]|uniref:Reverse transcriptase/retrotransposon-derived protein RNase H-like domain-containing protein n=1 Tax=Elysia crispata TaxID=231223 RepID=A0AAE1AY90_9GAST|nr:hypothetical protein RRG08_046372 [Elysia crispata]
MDRKTDAETIQSDSEKVRVVVHMLVPENKQNHEQEKILADIKKILSSDPVLKSYDSKQPVKIQCDASSTGLGACLMVLLTSLREEILQRQHSSHLGGDKS